MPFKLRCFLAALSANIIWGFVSIPIRLLKAYPAEQILFFRILTSLFICWLFILLFQRNKLIKDLKLLKTGYEFSNKKLRLLLLTSGFLITFNWYAFIYVINHVSLNSAAFAYMVCPLITALAGFVLLKEEISRLKFIGIGLAVISVIILATGSLRDVTWSVITASFYAFYLITQRVMQSLDKINVLGMQLAIAFCIILPVYIFVANDVTTDWIFWLNIIIIAVVFTLIPLFLSLYALEGLPSSTVGIIIYINPIIAFCVAFLYFHESIQINQIFAYTLLLVAVIIFNWKIFSNTLGKFRKRERVNFE